MNPTAHPGFEPLTRPTSTPGHRCTRLAVAITLWQATAHLLLTANGHWSGGGKWLHREVADLDRRGGTEFGRALAEGVRAVGLGAIEPMVAIVSEILGLVGGRLFEGFRAEGPG